ncbi:MAG TPA: ornithine cyclodeaminase family protein [Acetobacteraceae bacterium]|jgi:ornithine cyclodeaminase
MKILDAGQTAAALPFERLIPALRDGFVTGADVPLRHRHDLAQPDGATASLLLMPAWRAKGLMGVKVVSVFPGNGAHGLPSVSASYLLCDGATGQHLALIDGGELTRRRTAAASALAGSFLAREDAASLLVVGSGHVGGLMAEAYRVVRPIERVMVWNIRPAGAERLAARLGGEAVTDLAAAVRQADIVSCATLSREPLVRGEWLRQGTHLDLIGGFTPAMREADDAAVQRSCVFIDTDAALTEAGDLLDPIAHGVLRHADIAGSLFTLCRGETPGRRDATEITLFKSVGSALEDLAAAGLAYAGEAADGQA